MATPAENLATAYAAVCAALATGAGKPDYSINGQSVSWTSLLKMERELREALAASGGPFIGETIGEV